MESMTLFIILLVIAIILVGLVALIFDLCRIYKRKIYIHIETGKEYMPESVIQMKHPVTRKWVEAVLYRSLENGNIYVREKEDFIEKFIRLVDRAEANK
jgi:hypothetical protein